MKKYAIWYEPTGSVYDELKTIIISLADKYNSPIFEPHITLLPGGSGLSKEEIIEKLNSIITDSGQFQTELTYYDYLDDYFKCIFIKANETLAVMNFAKKIQIEFNGKPTPNFTPHLSVLYGQLENKEKEKIIQELGKTYNKNFALDKVDVIEFELGGSPKIWKKVASVKVETHE